MIWSGKSFIKVCKSFIDLIKLVSTLTCSQARVRGYSEAQKVKPAATAAEHGCSEAQKVKPAATAAYLLALGVRQACSQCCTLVWGFRGGGFRFRRAAASQCACMCAQAGACSASLAGLGWGGWGWGGGSPHCHLAAGQSSCKRALGLKPLPRSAPGATQSTNRSQCSYCPLVNKGLGNYCGQQVSAYYQAMSLTFSSTERICEWPMCWSASSAPQYPCPHPAFLSLQYQMVHRWSSPLLAIILLISGWSQWCA